MLTKKPKISIIVPAYNVEKILDGNVGSAYKNRIQKELLLHEMMDNIEEKAGEKIVNYVENHYQQWFSQYRYNLIRYLYYGNFVYFMEKGIRKIKRGLACP